MPHDRDALPHARWGVSFPAPTLASALGPRS